MQHTMCSILRSPKQWHTGRGGGAQGPCPLQRRISEGAKPVKRGANCMKWNKYVRTLMTQSSLLRRSFKKGKCRAYLRGVEIFRTLVYVYHIVAALRGYIYIYYVVFMVIHSGSICINLCKMFARIARNAVSEVQNFKIFRGRMPLYPPPPPTHIMWLN